MNHLSKTLAQDVVNRDCSAGAKCFGAILSAILLVPLTAGALPSTKVGIAALISPNSAETYYGTATTSTNSVGTTGYQKEIVELARALNNNPDQIYDFVRNYVDTVFMYGLQKGAMGSIVDKSGTPFDQAQLMVELLRQAGYTATYQVGTITLSGAQFTGWTNITNAQAACSLLASGGIPASVNGSSGNINCSNLSSSQPVSSVQLEHIWVSVVIPGSGTYLFDPSYKPYTFRSGVNLSASAQLTTGSALAAATGGASVGATGSGVGYAQNLNTGALNTKLATYASNLQSVIQTQNSPAPDNTPLISGQIKDLVGGGDIQRYVPPAGTPGQRITALPYSQVTVWQAWTGDIPDQFRTSLRVQLTLLFASTQTYAPTVDKTVFVDDIYGRKLIYDTNFNSTSFTGSLKLVDEFGNANSLASNTVTYNAGPTQTQNPAYSQGTITLSVNHPYAADSTGTATGGSYMDVSIAKSVLYSTPFTIVHGWGDTNRGLLDKWSSRLDTPLPPAVPQACNFNGTCEATYLASAGDGRREQLAAAWLVQSSKAARLHAAIANSIYTHHHTIGVVSGDARIDQVNINSEGLPIVYRFFVADNMDRIDVDTGFSLTSIASDPLARRAAVHAIAATEAALEGSVIGQTANLPDVVSVATRFQWGANPPAGEDFSGTPTYGPRPFYDFTSSNGATPSQVQPLMLVEGRTSSSASGCDPSSAEPTINSIETTSRQQINAATISSYASAGFDVIAAGEAFLGPGLRAGYKLKCATNFFFHLPSQERGGAMVATRYDASGDPLEIAHVAINTIASNIKGGGGAVQPDHAGVYDPSTAADLLKSRFVDRSNALGVDLQSGAVTYASPASLTVGNGGFPYALTANLIWRGGNVQSDVFGPRSDVEPQAPWTTNWNNTLTVSGSGLEVMDGDIRASAGTVAAFIAMQDIYRAVVSPSREVSAVLAASWWVQQLTGNVVTANVGTNTRQFVRAFDGHWIAPGAGSFATLNQTGTPVLYFEPGCGFGVSPHPKPRGWDYSHVSFSVLSAQGDTQNFAYWSNDVTTGGHACSRLHGFRLSNWSFPQGMNINLVYAQPPVQPSLQGLEQLVEVNNSLGRKIDFINSGLGGLNNGLSGADYRAVTMSELATVNPTTSITDAAGATTNLSHAILGGRHVVQQVFDATNLNVPALQYNYDTLLRVSQVLDAEALQVGDRGPYQFHFAENARADRIDPAGGIYSTYFDTYRRLLGTMDELGRTVSVAHDGRGRVLSYTYPELDKEVFAYDDRNNVTSLTKVAKPGSGLSNIAVQAQWNTTWNKPDWIIDARGYQTDFVYYPAGQAGASLLQTAARPAPTSGSPRPVYSFTYNSRGQILTVTDPAGVLTASGYDPSTGNLASSTLDPYGIASVTQYGYDNIGNILIATDPRLNVAENIYDNDRRKTITKHHNGSVAAAVIAAERTNYDLLGRVGSEEGGTAFSGTDVTAWKTLKSTLYTPTSQPRTVADALGNIITYGYDGADRVTLVTDPDGRRLGTVYDAAGETLCTWKGWNNTSAPTSCTWDPASYTTLISPLRYAAYTYTANGKQSTILDANNNPTRYQYDGFDRLAFVYFPDPDTGTLCSDGPAGGPPSCSGRQTYEQHQSDNNGNVYYVRTRKGDAINSTFDALNRLLTKTAQGRPQVSYAYDLAGKPLSLADSQHSVNYHYDSAGRKQYEQNDSRAVSYQYDLTGNRTQTTWPDNYFVTYSYDALNRMEYVLESGSAELAHYQYDSLSRRQSLTYAANGSNAVSYTYEDNGSLRTLNHAMSALVNFTYSRNYSGQITNVDATDGFYLTQPGPKDVGYMVNKLNQYVGVGAITSADANGNPIVGGASSGKKWVTIPIDDLSIVIPVKGKPGLTPDANQADPGGDSLVHDLNGNLLKWSDANGRNSYTYDSENRLRTAAVAGSAVAGISYDYDPLGRRISKTVNGTMTQYLLDGEEEIGEYDSSWSLQRRYITGPAIDDRIAIVDSAGTKSYYRVNHQGSVIAMTDLNGAVTGSNADRYAYDEYGNLLAGSTGGQPLRYTGRRYDGETGLYYYRARYYSPVLGRFLQTDPIGYEDDLDLYAYVGNDSINATDPTGLACNFLNSGSAYCQRADRYAAIDARVSVQTRFFAAASATVQSLASMDLPGGGYFVSDQTRATMSSLSSRLESLNTGIARSIESGSLNGSGLDARIVHMEQTAVQGVLDNLNSSNSDAYKSLVGEVNGLLNPSSSTARAAGSFFSSDSAYGRVLDGVRKDLGRNIDFSKQGDREAIGNAVINEIRKSGGCDVTGSRIKSC